MGELRFDGRVAVVTGAGGGLGASHAAALAARGAMVVVNDLGTTLDGDGHDRNPAEEQVARIVAAGGRAVANFEDVSNPDGAARIIAHAIDAFGRIDIVVNNAGNFISDVPLEQTTPERLDRLWRVHVQGTVNVLRAAWPHFVAANYGRVVNTASQAGYLGVPNKYEYDIVKSSMLGLTKTLAFEAAQHGIRANALCPAANTRPLRAMADELPEGTLPSGFFGPAFDPALVSPLVVWLAHEDCPANGETFMAMSGTVTRMVVAETHGFFAPDLSAEDIRDNFDRIMTPGDLSGSNLLVPGNATERGADVIERFLAHGIDVA